MKSFRALAALLSYPGSDVPAVVPEIRVALAEGAVPQAPAAAIEPLLADLATRDLYDLQERRPQDRVRR